MSSSTSHFARSDFNSVTRLLALALPLLALSLLMAQPAMAQDTSLPVEDPERIPSSAWLLPFDSLRGGEPITWTIVLASIVAVTLIIQGFLRVRKVVIIPPESNQRIEQLILGRNFRELVDFTGTDDSFVSRALHPALKRAPAVADMREALETSIAEETAEEFRKIEYINILANIGPLLGLLGTVVGIMDAFLAMRRVGGAADVGALAEGISTALGTTMLGLILAIPCLICYGILRNKADRITQEGAELAEEFLQMMKNEGREARAATATAAALNPSGAARPATPAARPSSPPPPRATAEAPEASAVQPQ